MINEAEAQVRAAHAAGEPWWMMALTMEHPEFKGLPRALARVEELLDNYHGLEMSPELRFKEMLVIEKRDDEGLMILATENKAFIAAVPVSEVQKWREQEPFPRDRVAFNIRECIDRELLLEAAALTVSLARDILLDGLFGKYCDDAALPNIGIVAMLESVDGHTLANVALASLPVTITQLK